MSTVAELRSDLECAAEEVARLRAFLAAIAEQAALAGEDSEMPRIVCDSKLAVIRSLAVDAADPTAPVPGRVAKLWDEQVEGL